MQSRFSTRRLADLKALNIILACIPTSLKREIRPTTSAALWKDLTTRFDRQDLDSLLALYRDFQAISLEASPNAATFTRRLTDAARRLTDRDITITDSLLMARILDDLPTAYTTHKIAFTTARTGTPSSDAISWLLDAEVDLFHSSSPLTAALVRGGGSGRGTPSSGFGGGCGAGRGGRGGGGRSTPRQGGGRGAGRGGASGLGTLSPCQYLIRYGLLKGQRCLQTTHTTATCFKALTDEWFERAPLYLSGPSHLPNSSSTHPPHPIPPFSPSPRIPCFSPTPSLHPLVPFTITPPTPATPRPLPLPLHPLTHPR
ncbi:unnamed protein product [Closterium sp. NIES-65]|nr:unnamed protein product [Closterium sp. NIES-65]